MHVLINAKCLRRTLRVHWTQTRQRHARTTTSRHVSVVCDSSTSHDHHSLISLYRSTHTLCITAYISAMLASISLTTGSIRQCPISQVACNASVIGSVVTIYMVACSSVARARLPLYFTDVSSFFFPAHRTFSDVGKPTSPKLSHTTWLSIQQNLCYSDFYKVPRKTNGGRKTQNLYHFSCQVADN